jgi:hypothetical protein
MNKQLKQNGFMYVEKLIPEELAQFLTHALLRGAQLEGQISDEQVPGALTVMYGDYYLETLQESLWPIIEKISGEELLPTYSYSRLYQNGNNLEKHTDRPECEISVTLQMGKSHEYRWPIFMGGNMFELKEGDAVIYRGCDIPHWRDVCDGPKAYYSGQVFFHFVRKNGPYADRFGDKRPNPEKLFVKNRSINAV